MDTEPMLQLLLILEKSISPDRNELEAAEKYLEHAAVTNFTPLIKMLSDVLAQGGNSQVARMAAGLQLKNHLTSKDVTLKQQYQQRWLALPEETRLYIKKNILAATGTEDGPLSAAQCVAYVALAELPVGQGNELIPSLVEGRPPAGTSRFYARGALQYLAQAERAEIVPHFLPFINLNIKHEDWRFREAALMAFGKLLIDGNEYLHLKPLVEKAMPTLIEAMYDSSVAVRDTAAHTFQRICIMVPEAAINETYLNPMLESLVNGLKAEPCVAASVCWALHSLAEAAYEAADGGDSNQPTTYCMSNYFDFIVQRLLETTDRQDAAQHNLGPAAYETLMKMVKNSPSDCYVTVQKTIMVILERLQQVWQMENHISSQADRSQFENLYLLCHLLVDGLLKVTPEDAPQISDAVMTALLTMFASHAGKAGEVQDESLMVVSTVVEVLGEGFLKYMDALKRYLYVLLKNHQEYKVCIAAVRLTGDIFRALQNKALPYCDEIILLLVETLGDPSIHRSVKPKILSVFGVIARSVGADFAKYFDVVMQMLLQASNAQVDRNDFAMVEYLGWLRKSVLEAYTGIIQGLEDAGEEVRADVSLVEPHVPAIVNFMMTVATEPELTDGHTQLILGLTGDLCTAAFGARVLPLLEQRPLLDLLATARRSRTPRTKNLADWATREIRELKQQPPPATWSVYHILYCWSSARCSTCWHTRAAAARRAPRTSPTGPPGRSASSSSSRRPPPDLKRCSEVTETSKQFQTTYCW